MPKQGLNFTLIEAPDVQEQANAGAVGERWPDARKVFSSARRVWLGYVPGVDWLHEAIESEFGEDQFWYDVKSERTGVHIGAAGEIAGVVLVLLSVSAVEFARRFGGRLGERSADGLIEWVRQRAATRREERGLGRVDPGMDFSLSEPESLAEFMKGELADLTDLPAERLELVQYERPSGFSLTARYRDTESGVEYHVEVFRDEAVFIRRPAQ